MVLYIDGKRVSAIRDKQIGEDEASQTSVESNASQPSGELADTRSRPLKAKRAPIQKRIKLEGAPAASPPKSLGKKVKSKVSGEQCSPKVDKVAKSGEILLADSQVNDKTGERATSLDSDRPDIQASLLGLAFEKLLARPEIQAVLAQSDGQGNSVSRAIEAVLAEALGETGMKQATAQQELLSKVNLNAAGLDIGAEEIWVCVPDGRDEELVRKFATFTPDLHALAKWLKQCGIDTVAMESTGVYWIPIYDILETQGLKVYLVNARHVKNVSGRKTDVLDCQPAWRQTGGFKPCTPMACCKPRSDQPRTSVRCVPMCGIGTTWFVVEPLISNICKKP